MFLASAGRQEALKLADRLLESGNAGDALPILEHLVASGQAGQLFDVQRSGQLLKSMSDARYRMTATELLSRKRDAIKADDLGFPLMLLALDKQRPLSAEDCLDFSLFGPFTSPKLGLIVVIASKQPYTGRIGDYAACAQLLSPFDRNREVLSALATGRGTLLRDG